eukprot:jgi/Mesen1/9667/ME000671S09019
MTEKDEETAQSVPGASEEVAGKEGEKESEMTAHGTAGAGAPEAAEDASKGEIASLQGALEEVKKELAVAKKELATRIKHYESKLMTMSVINGALQSENEKLKEAVELSQGGESSAEQELAELQEEFTKRLGVAEKTASYMKEECFGLRKQVEELKKSSQASTQQLGEKHASLEQARPAHAPPMPMPTPSHTCKEERDMHARKAGELEGLIRRLRSDAARVEQDKEKLTARVQVLEAAAKSEEVSRSALLEEANQAAAALRQALSEQKEHFSKLLEDAGKRKEAEVRKVREELSQQTSRSAREVHEREAMLSSTLDGLRQKLAQASQEASEREDKLRREVQRMEERCRDAERAAEDAAAAVTHATRPLVRQMESMRGQLAQKEALLHEHEHLLQEQLREAETATRAATDACRRADASCQSAERRAEAAERAATDAQTRAASALSQLSADEAHRKELKEQWAAALEQAAVAEQGQKDALAALSAAHHAREVAERELTVARLEAEAELADLRQRNETLQASAEKRERDRERGAGSLSSPMGRVASSPRDREASGAWHLDDLRETPPSPATSASTSSPLSALSLLLGRRSSSARGSFDSADGQPLKSGGGAIAQERLTAKVRQQQGEIAQLQRELTAAKSALEHANEEDGAQLPQLKKELEELQKRHDMALIIIGERNERVEELEADLADVKTLYREQMSMLIGQVDPDKWPEGYRICLFCSHCAQNQRSRKRG